MIKSYVIAVMLAMFTIAAVSCFNGGNPAAQTQGLPIVQVGQSYRVVVGMAALSFKVLEVGKAGLVKVQAVEDARAMQINAGSIWWLNLNQALLVEAK
jgi:hypothetical protein